MPIPRQAALDQPSPYLEAVAEREQRADVVSLAPWLGTPEAKDRVVGFLRTAAPLRNWLDQRTGPDSA